MYIFWGGRWGSYTGPKISVNGPVAKLINRFELQGHGHSFWLYIYSHLRPSLLSLVDCSVPNTTIIFVKNNFSCLSEPDPRPYQRGDWRR